MPMKKKKIEIQQGIAKAKLEARGNHKHTKY